LKVTTKIHEVILRNKIVLKGDKKKYMTEELGLLCEMGEM